MSPKSSVREKVKDAAAASAAAAADTAEGAKGGGTTAGAAGKPARGSRQRSGLFETVAAAADLLEEGDRAHAGIPSDARDLLLTEIEPDPMQPRRHFDAGDLRALADDIARRGVLQPILVRPVPPGDGVVRETNGSAGGSNGTVYSDSRGVHYRIVAGERRWRASQMAGKVRIPARVKDLTDDEVRAAQLAENVLRAGLTDIEKGRALRELYEIRKRADYRTTWEDIASEVGLGRARIHDLFHLADLPEAVGALIAAGRLSGSHGVALQRARGILGDPDLVTLAEQAARPAGRSTGAYPMSVARLRTVLTEMQERAHAGISAILDTVEMPPAAANGLDGGVPSSSINNGDDRPVSTRRTGGSVRRASGGDSGLRPFVRRTLEALETGSLSGDERALLLAALTGGDGGDPPGGNSTSSSSSGGGGGRDPR